MEKELFAKMSKELEEYIKEVHRENILTEQDFYDKFTIDVTRFMDAGFYWDDITEIMADMDPMYEDAEFHSDDNIRTIAVV